MNEELEQGMPPLIVEERSGECADCGHTAHSAPQWVRLRRALRLRVLPARCGSDDGIAGWELSGGVGAVSACVCRAAFHAS